MFFLYFLDQCNISYLSVLFHSFLQVRAENLAKDIGKELSKIQAAKSGWAKAKKVGGRLSVMRLLRKTTDQQVREQSRKRIAAALEMTDDEKLQLFNDSK